MNFWETVTRGEYVMFALAVLLIAGVVIWWARSAVLYSYRHKEINLMHRVRDYVVDGDIDNAVEICATSNFPGARIIGAGLSRLGRPMSEVTEAMRLAMDSESGRLEKGKRWIYAIGIMAPLIGAAGTLGGICDGLERVADAGTMADIALLGAEIAPTIVSTIAGLGVGVFSIFIYFCLDGTVEKSKSRLTALAAEFEDLLNEPA